MVKIFCRSGKQSAESVLEQFWEKTITTHIRSTKRALAVAAVAAVLANSALAHHGHNSQFDVTKLIDVAGVITKIRFVNPHSYVYFDVATKNGDVENWYCEMRASNVLKRSGWTKDMFQPGQRIRVEGIASRKSATGCYVETVTVGEDVVLNRYDQVEENKGRADTDRAAKTPWGDPNLAGDWAAVQQLIGRVSGPNAARGPAELPPPGVEPPPAVKLNAAGTQAVQEMIAALQSQPEVPANFTGRLDCAPRDFHVDWIFDQNANRIIQEEDTVTMKYGFMDTVRTIHLNTKTHPTDITPSFAGHSIGHWEDDVLVVDTIGFAPSLIKLGPHVTGVRSEKYHVVERISVDNKKGELTISYVANDPKFWDSGQTISHSTTVFVSDYPWEPYECEDLTDE